MYDCCAVAMHSHIVNRKGRTMSTFTLHGFADDHRAMQGTTVYDSISCSLVFLVTRSSTRSRTGTFSSSFIPPRSFYRPRYPPQITCAVYLCESPTSSRAHCKTRRKKRLDDRLGGFSTAVGPTLWCTAGSYLRVTANVSALLIVGLGNVYSGVSVTRESTAVF